MKKLFSSAISAAAALVFMVGSGHTALLADALNTESGICESTEIIFTDSAEIELTMPQLPSILSNNSENAYNYKDFLDENNLAVYEELMSWITPSLDTVTVELPETVSLSLTGLPGSSSYTEEDAAAFSEAVFSACKPGIDSLCFDMPEIFWLDLGQLSIGTDSMSYTYNRTSKKYNVKINALTFKPALDPSFESIDNAIQYKEKLETAVECFEVTGETRYDQLKSIHDTIALFTNYNVDASFASSALGALVEPGVVCEGYSKGLKLICDRLDIPCVLVFGNYDAEENVAHMWNYVMMDNDCWYAVDLTWDDLDGTSGSEIKYQYFIKGSESFCTNHTAEENYLGTIFTYPELAASDYEAGETTAPETTTSTTTTTTTTTATTTSETSTTSTTSTTASTTTTTTTTDATTSSTTTTTMTETTTVTTTTTAEKTSATTITTTSETLTTQKPVTTSETTTAATTEMPAETTTVQTEPPTEATTAVPEYEQGDFNKDGVVNVADLVACAKAVLGIESDYICDYDNDGVVDFIDMILIRKCIMLKYQ